MRARLGIDKTKAWADWAEEEEEADAMILTLEAATEPRCMVNTVRGPQCPVWPEFAMTDYRMAMSSSPPSSTPAVAETITEVTPHSTPPSRPLRHPTLTPRGPTLTPMSGRGGDADRDPGGRQG